MAEKINDAARNRATDSVGDDFNSAIMYFYTGSQPASAGSAATGTLLGQGTLPADAMAAASGGVAAKSGTWTISISVGGDVGYFRVVSASGDRRYDGAVTATGGGGEIELPSVTVVAGQNVTVNTFTITQPAS